MLRFYMYIFYFINIFAVHPRDNFRMHTLPFTVMIMAVSINAIRTSSGQC